MTYEQTVYANNIQLLLLFGTIVMLGIALSLFIDYLKNKKFKREQNEKQDSTNDSKNDRF